MKKFLGIVVLGLLLSGNSFANDNRKCINETGFVSDKFNFSKNIKFEDPENTLIFMYHHGGAADKASTSDCVFSEERFKNVIKLTKEDFGTNYTYLYVVNTKPLYGDAYKDRKNKTKWKAFPVGEYPGKTKIEKKIDLINEINENFYSQGIKPKNIIMTGHSNGGYASLLYTARHPDKVRGAIAYHPACCGKLTKFDIATEKGRKKWLKDENWKCPIKEKGKYPCAEAFWTFRSKIIDEILSNKNLKAVVIHNNDDPYDGKHSEWLKEIKTVKFIETPGKKDKWKINGKSCKGLKPFGHNVHTSPCMSEYFPEIIAYFK